MKILLISLLLASCGSKYESYAQDAAPQYRFTEILDVSKNIQRLENSEVVCYRDRSGESLQCKFKQYEKRFYLDARGQD